MNIRQQKYKKNRIAGMNTVNAAIAAGYSKKYSLKKGYRIERMVKVGLTDEFERAGLTDKAIVNHALEGLEANKVISCNIIAPDGEGMKDANSMTKDFVDVPDWCSRHRYFETILKLTDKLNDKNNGSSHEDNSKHFYFINCSDFDLIQEMKREQLDIPVGIEEKLVNVEKANQDIK